jgi:hypothetical protein
VKKVSGKVAMTEDAFEAAETQLLKYQRLFASRMVNMGLKSTEPKEESSVLEEVAEILTCAFWPECIAMARAKTGPLAHKFHQDMLHVIDGKRL